MPNPLESVPNGDSLTWLIGWRDRESGDTGSNLVKAAHVDEAIRGFERDNPSRRVLSVYQSPISI